MKIEDIKYDQERHFYWEVLNCGNRASYQDYIDRFLVHKGEGFVWIDLFNKLGQCKELPTRWNLAREQLFKFVGHNTMLNIVNKYAITQRDRDIADKAMKTFRAEFNELVRPEASFSTRCRYTIGF